MDNLLINNKKLMQEYNFDRNINVDLNNLKVGSHKKIWWRCLKGHEWEAEIKSRNSGRNCPYCANKVALAGYNDLVTTNPELAKEWNYEKNGMLNHTQVLANSHKKVWWKCQEGHEWIASVIDRNKNRGCPYCGNKKIIVGYNDLTTTNPELAKEWNHKKNKSLKPENVFAGSERKVWWKCLKGHEWEASIKNRNTGQKCPYCTNTTLLVGYNDLATTNPDLAKEWNYEKNGDLKPSDIIAGSNRIIWWKCSKGHEWKAKALHRSYGHNCPYCTNKFLLKGFNDLETVNPRIAKEWNYSKNLSLKPNQVLFGSHKKVWWKCSKGHEWEATISSRNNGIGCPTCSEELRTSFPERTIYFYVKKYFPDAINNYRSNLLNKKELDIFVPSLNVGIEYDGELFHKNIQKDLIKDELCKKNNIKLYRIREKNCLDYKSSSTKIYLKNNDLISLSESIAYLLKKLNVNNCIINIDNDLDNIYSLISYIEKEESLEKNNPELVKEWNYEKNGDLKPSQVSCGSHKKVWWKCSKGHEWRAEIKSRNSGRRCPYCLNNKVLAGYNDLATTNPELAKEWNYEKNGDLKPTDVTAGSDRRVWWKCPNGHEWDAVIRTRVNGYNKCSICKSKKII